ncbi:MAG: type 4a pilus biogenesis protein PilO [Thermodesulfobacteriota bacterium]
MALKPDDLAKIPAKQKVLVAVLLSAMIVAGYYYLYYQEASRTATTLETQLTSLRAKIKEQEVIAGNLPSFQAEVQRLEGQLALLLEQLPNSAEIPSLLKNISDLGKESGLEFLKFAPGGEVKKDFYAEIPVSISVNGDYHSFAQFADKVAHYPRIVNLSNISFQNPKTAKTEGTVLSTVTCSATTYRFIEQAPSAQGAGDKGKAK